MAIGVAIGAERGVGATVATGGATVITLAWGRPKDKHIKFVCQGKRFDNSEHLGLIFQSESFLVRKPEGSSSLSF